MLWKARDYWAAGQNLLCLFMINLVFVTLNLFQGLDAEISSA